MLQQKNLCSKLLKIRPRNRVQWSCLAVLGKQAALSSSSFKVSERSGHPFGHVVFAEKSQFFFNDSAGEC